MRVRYRPAPPRLAPFEPGRDDADDVRLAELERRVCMAFFDTLPREARAQMRAESGNLVPPPAFVGAELVRAGVRRGLDGGLILP